MVSTYPAQRAVEPEPIEATHLDASSTEPPEEAPRGVTDGPPPVVNQPNFDAFSGLRRQKFGELPARFVFMNDVGFEMNPSLSGFDGFNPGRVILLRILEEPDSIPK